MFENGDSGFQVAMQDGVTSVQMAGAAFYRTTEFLSAILIPFRSRNLQHDS